MSEYLTRNFKILFLHLYVCQHTNKQAYRECKTVNTLPPSPPPPPRATYPTNVYPIVFLNLTSDSFNIQSSLYLKTSFCPQNNSLKTTHLIISFPRLFLYDFENSHCPQKPGAVARSEASSLGMQAAPSSIPTSGTFFRGDLVMKTFLRPFSLFRWFKKRRCQLLARECALSTAKLPRRLAQEQCG